MNEAEMSKTRDLLKQVIFGLVIGSILITLSGCMGSPGLTVDEVKQRHHRYVYTNWLMFQDDADDFLMTDRPSRLSEYYTR